MKKGQMSKTLPHAKTSGIGKVGKNSRCLADVNRDPRKRGIKMCCRKALGIGQWRKLLFEANTLHDVYT
jgi:hypothetical protein